MATLNQRLAELEKKAKTTTAERYTPEEAARYQRMGLSANPGDANKPAETAKWVRLLNGDHPATMTAGDIRWIADAVQSLYDEL